MAKGFKAEVPLKKDQVAVVMTHKTAKAVQAYLSGGTIHPKVKNVAVAMFNAPFVNPEGPAY